MVYIDSPLYFTRSLAFETPDHKTIRLRPGAGFRLVTRDQYQEFVPRKPFQFEMFVRTTDVKFMMILILSMLKDVLLFILTMTGDYHDDYYDYDMWFQVGACYTCVLFDPR